MLTILFTGCTSVFPRHEPVEKNSYDEYARKCYGLAVSYMEESRYELARQQFSLAAASAVSEPLYLKAAEGVQRAEQFIKHQR
ncbi:MAG: hypothetical protein ACLFV2_08915 [Desulfurivibrionaceae bacterium]